MSSGQNGCVRKSRVYPVHVSRGPDRPMPSSPLTYPSSFDPSNFLTTLSQEAFHDRHANLCLCCGKPIAFPADCCRDEDCKDCHRNSCPCQELKGRVGQQVKGYADCHHPFELAPANIVPSGGRPVETRCTIVANANNHVAQGKHLFTMANYTMANLRMIDEGLEKITLYGNPDMQVQVKDIRGKTTKFTLSLGAVHDPWAHGLRNMGDNKEDSAADLVITRPFIKYCGYKGLVERAQTYESKNLPDIAYLTTGIYQVAGLCDRGTKETMSLSGGKARTQAEVVVKFGVAKKWPSNRMRRELESTLQA
ncbi:hypothetical protein B0T26DRAFT_753805 [Lasiosphaeria miniovina]|uniref:Uncharacterized protein n=1 Tax=Lasiosphaeria miniovina TaxID=1954250 RepID=A0AA40ADC1_9PEZI|nr:uncharacterized protein B0T26DRAFT_753805 [Lasiosphaeria miniovina]KAK0713717.1 hypothetical protein B0T26DRAFT_753805 [Lasiosphaeria miniovina]